MLFWRQPGDGSADPVRLGGTVAAMDYGELPREVPGTATLVFDGY